MKSCNWWLVARRHLPNVSLYSCTTSALINTTNLWEMFTSALFTSLSTDCRLYSRIHRDTGKPLNRQIVKSSTSVEWATQWVGALPCDSSVDISAHFHVGTGNSAMLLLLFLLCPLSSIYNTQVDTCQSQWHINGFISKLACDSWFHVIFTLRERRWWSCEPCNRHSTTWHCAQHQTEHLRNIGGR